MTEKLKGMIDAALDTLGEQLDNGGSEQLKEFLRVMARFHRYSVGNAILIALQRPGATHVCGFHGWLKVGRHVKQGEKGIQILAPMTRRKTVVLENDEELTDETVVAFRPAYVFDVEQTDGKPLPEPATVRGDPGDLLNRLETFVATLGIEVEYAERLDGAEGLAAGHVILLRTGLDAANVFATCVHEAAHHLLHLGKEMPDRKTREIEAEAAAFVVCQAVGLESGTASSDYLLTYKADRKTLMGSLQRIQRTAAMIIDAVMSEPAAKRQEAGQVSQAAAA